MLSHERMLRLLNFFDLNRPEWSLDDLLAVSGYSRSTLYRYLKTLTDFGLLATLPGHGYTLGPRIIELNYQILMTDPLIHAARPVMSELVSSQSGVCLLCRRYRQRVLCVHQESSTPSFRSNYERGRSRPLLRGAASLAILCQYSAYQLKKIYEQESEEFARVGLGETLAEVREALREMRAAGWIHTEGQVKEGVTGIASPIFDSTGEVVGSVSLTLPETNIKRERLVVLGERISFSARIISNSLSAEGPAPVGD